MKMSKVAHKILFKKLGLFLLKTNEQLFSPSEVNEVRRISLNVFID